MNLSPFWIEINGHPPFIGLFESSCAAFETFHALAAAEAPTFNGFRLKVRPIKAVSPWISFDSHGGAHGGRPERRR